MDTKPAYSIDPDGYFVGQTVAHESPEEEGVWHVPAGAVLVAPPLPSAGERARWLGEAWTLEPVPEPEAEAEPAPEPPVDLEAYVAHRRWRTEVAGVVWNGLPVQTDRDSRANYTAMILMVDKGLRLDGAKYKFGDGIARPLPNADVLPMSMAAAGHVQGCYDLEADLAAGIVDGTITTTEQIDSAFAALEPEGA